MNSFDSGGSSAQKKVGVKPNSHCSKKIFENMSIFVRNSWEFVSIVYERAEYVLD